MFEVGKSYTVVTLVSGQDDGGKVYYSESSIAAEVGGVDGTLVKFLGPDWSKDEFSDFRPASIKADSPRDETIINTASPFFVRAELSHH